MRRLKLWNGFLVGNSEPCVLMEPLGTVHYSTYRLPFTGGHNEYILKGLILAQNERWRRGLGMQVVRFM